MQKQIFQNFLNFIKQNWQKKTNHAKTRELSFQVWNIPAQVCFRASLMSELDAYIQPKNGNQCFQPAKLTFQLTSDCKRIIQKSMTTHGDCDIMFFIGLAYKFQTRDLFDFA